MGGDFRGFMKISDFFNNSAPILQNRSGFTLLEIMIAVSVLAIVLVTVYQLQTQTVQMAIAVQFETGASLSAQQQIAVFETDSGDPNGIFGETKTAGTEHKRRINVVGVGSPLAETINADLKQLDVTIYYEKDQQSYHIRTYRFDPQ
jgi:general secretion pathway protein I